MYCVMNPALTAAQIPFCAVLFSILLHRDSVACILKMSRSSKLPRISVDLQVQAV